MSLSAEVLMQLSELELAPDQMSAVLRIIAGMQAKEDDRKAKQRERTAKFRTKNVTVTLPERDCNGDGNAQKVPSSSPKENNQTPTPTDQKDTPIARARSDFPKDAFESHFWPLYPRKVAKGAARKAFDKIEATGKIHFADLMAGLQRFARAPPEPQFTPHASTWLNDERWNDEPANNPSPSLFSGSFARASREDPFVLAARREIDEMRRAGRG